MCDENESREPRESEKREARVRTGFRISPTHSLKFVAAKRGEPTKSAAREAGRGRVLQGSEIAGSRPRAEARGRRAERVGKVCAGGARGGGGVRCFVQEMAWREPRVVRREHSAGALTVDSSAHAVARIRGSALRSIAIASVTEGAIASVTEPPPRRSAIAARPHAAGRIRPRAAAHGKAASIGESGVSTLSPVAVQYLRARSQRRAAARSTARGRLDRT